MNRATRMTISAIWGALFLTSVATAANLADAKKTYKDAKKAWDAANRSGNDGTALPMPASLEAHEISDIAVTGDCSRRIDVLFISADFPDAKRKDFEGQASKLSDFILKVEPWGRYRDYINFRMMWLPKNNVRSQANGDSIVSDAGKVHAYSQMAPDADLPIVLYNVKEGRATCQYLWNPVFELSIRTSYITLHSENDVVVMAHEMGHAWGWLGDEYVDPMNAARRPLPNPESVWLWSNTTWAGSDWKKTKWNYWNMPDDPAVRKMDQIVDCCEGGYYRSKGVWRPSENSLMNNHTKCKDYNVPSLEAVERRFYELVSPIDSHRPRESSILLFNGEKQKFETTILMLTGNWDDIGKMTPVFLVDGEEVSVVKGGKSVSVSLEADKLDAGVHDIVSFIFFDNKNIRRDGGFIEDSRYWQVNVVKSPRPKFSVNGKMTVKAGEQIAAKWQVASPIEGCSFSATAVPEGATISADGAIVWTPQTPGKYALTVTYGNDQFKVFDTQTITVTGGGKSDKPFFRFQPLYAVTECAPLEIDIIADDSSDEHILYSIDNLPFGATFDSNTGRFRWTPDLLSTGDYTLNVTAENSSKTEKMKLRIYVREYPANIESLRYFSEKNEDEQSGAAKPVIIGGVSGGAVIGPNDLAKRALKQMSSYSSNYRADVPDVDYNVEENILVMLRSPNELYLTLAYYHIKQLPEFLRLLQYIRLMRCKFPAIQKMAFDDLNEMMAAADETTRNRMYCLMATVLSRSFTRFVMYPALAKGLHLHLEAAKQSDAFKGKLHTVGYNHRKAMERWDQMVWFWNETGMK